MSDSSKSDDAVRSAAASARDEPSRTRRGMLLCAGLMAGVAATAQAAGTAFDSAPKTVNSGNMPAPTLDKSAGPIRARTMNAMIPGLVNTPLTRHKKRLVESMSETGHAPPDRPTPQQAWDERKPTVPWKVGWPQPEDIAAAAVVLASDAAAMVMGAEYEVTGGDSSKDI